MTYLYNRTFKIGFVATLVIFFVLNLVSYLFAARQYDNQLNPPIAYSPGPRFPAWGFPFAWEGYNLSYVQNGPLSELFAIADGVVLNFLAITACGFLVGLAFRALKRNYE